jgi:hypothetical protein
MRCWARCSSPNTRRPARISKEQISSATTGSPLAFVVSHDIGEALLVETNFPVGVDAERDFPCRQANQDHAGSRTGPPAAL